MSGQWYDGSKGNRKTKMMEQLARTNFLVLAEYALTFTTRILMNLTLYLFLHSPKLVKSVRLVWVTNPPPDDLPWRNERQQRTSRKKNYITQFDKCDSGVFCSEHGVNSCCMSVNILSHPGHGHSVLNWICLKFPKDVPPFIIQAVYSVICR